MARSESVSRGPVARAAAPHAALPVGEAVAPHVTLPVGEAAAPHVTLPVGEAAAPHVTLPVGEAAAPHAALPVGEAVAPHVTLPVGEASAPHVTLPAPRASALNAAAAPHDAPVLNLPAELLAARFDREPFGFTHNLHTLELFRFDSLLSLAKKFAAAPRDYFVAAAAPSAATQFEAVPHGQCAVEEALNRLDSSAVRVLLKRPENHDARFRHLLDTLFEQVLALRGGLKGERVVRLESAVFLTSASSITPCHFDPEIAFFAQIEGRKNYHVFSPASMSEAELESFYRRGIVSIAQVDLPSRDPGLECFFPLKPGEGHHQPQNSPHWVETCAERSVSYSFVFETDKSRARNRTRACNHYLRGAGIHPRALGASPARDAAKAAAMRVVFPIRRRISAIAAKIRKA